ncbi:glutamate N-acetyltransferase/amino-acid N-acetyltransferase [Desulfobaculum xiamenense]|uniref:Arginine biosynthesis bifunctional protein ArgJ n=1 Tax=Desulfobaculum xiamenense TaxID=995050 RepID=A0A846QVF1_9BACT|nr:bifunctional glutamate N-acetyltransferase/amino-acid acetyltransferase ArgJ [Desulfobaculum xiamenense]NJB68619.1 glutamate N-acetyltransferase/amino-acid N-acetyltransferase [Desulfobaculum xiamenense]
MLVPQGFRFATAAAGFKKPGRNDLALVLSDTPASAAGVFTTNRFQAAPVLVSRERLVESETAMAVVINSGQANACTGDEGLANCRETLRLVGRAVGVDKCDVLCASTGVIGQQLKMDLWRETVPQLAKTLGANGPLDVAKAIMTTDTFAKVAWASVGEGDAQVRVLGFAKGAGMICPNMATMLGCVLTDAAVPPQVWRSMLREAVDASFNCVTVDGDTSTNDTVFGLANGASGVSVDDIGATALADAVREVCRSLAYMIVQDAEGGTKVVRITVSGARDDAEADMAARAVGNSPLVKTAMFGQDPNWGRIAAALGRSGAAFMPEDVSISIAGLVIFEAGQPVDIDFDSLLAPHLRKPDIDIRISLGRGPGGCELLASDLTHDYVSINADYRS